MGRRRQNAGFLRLTATALAVLGLLGHGLAMLAVSLLAQTAASSAAAQPSFPAFIEICTADGLTTLAASELPGGENRAPAGPPSGKIDSCPVCSAFAQNGPVDLPATALALLGPEPGAAALPAAHQVAAPSSGTQLPLSRGPPSA